MSTDPLTGALLLAAVRRSVAERHDSGACHATPWVCAALDCIGSLCGVLSDRDSEHFNGYAAAEDALRAFLEAR